LLSRLKKHSFFFKHHPVHSTSKIGAR
jgi:hypothetical protein